MTALDDGRRVEWSIRDLAAAAGVTSRTLRHYERIGLLIPSRVADNGYRLYGEPETVRLYRILSLRALRMPLPAIRAVLDDGQTLVDAVRTHARLLEEHRSHIAAQIAAVASILAAIENGESLSMDQLLRTIDHARHEPEVRARWGDDAWERSQQRRDAMSPAEHAADRRRATDVNAALRAAAEAGHDPVGDELQQVVSEHYAWVTDQRGSTKPSRDAYIGLSVLYVADARFTAVYGGAGNAETIRRAIQHWAERNL